MSVFEDECAIRNLGAQYTDAVNRRDGYGMAAVYAPDGVLEMGERRIVGMEKLLKGFRRNVEEQRECLYQMTHSSLVHVDGDTAEARFWFSEIRKPTGEPYDYGYGVYQDSLVRRPEGWRFSVRRVASLVRWTPPEGQLAHFPLPPFLALGATAGAATS